jgi:hypothetical protein
LSGIRESADVRKDLDARAVEGNRRFERVGEVLLAPLFGALLRLADADNVFRRRVQPQRARIAVENHDRTVRHVERGWLDTSQRRDAQRSGEDGDVRRGAAASRAKTDDARAVERRRVRGCEIFGDEDGVRRILP